MDISHKILETHATGHRPKEANKKEGLSEDASISLRKGNKIVVGGRWRGNGGIRSGVWRDGGDGPMALRMNGIYSWQG